MDVIHRMTGGMLPDTLFVIVKVAVEDFLTLLR